MTDTFIRAVAGEIKGHDAKFEENLREREKNNPKFAFLLRKDVSSVHVHVSWYLVNTSTADMLIIGDLWNPVNY